MAGSPMFKVYREGEYVAACKYAEDAAAVVALSGGEVRLGHAARCRLFVEGQESVDAANSYDGAAQIILDRARALCAAARIEGGA